MLAPDMIMHLGSLLAEVIVLIFYVPGRVRRCNFISLNVPYVLSCAVNFPLSCKHRTSVEFIRR